MHIFIGWIYQELSHSLLSMAWETLGMWLVYHTLLEQTTQNTAAQDDNTHVSHTT